MDREGCCIYMNPRAIDICKSTVPSSTRQSWAQSLGLEDPASIMASWSATASIEYSETFRICTPDSTWRWIEVRTLPIVSGGGMVAGHSGVVQDISERWLAQRQTTARDTITQILAHAESPRERLQRDSAANLERSSAGIRAFFGAWTGRRGPCGQLQSGRAVIQVHWRLRPTLAGPVLRPASACPAVSG